METSLRVRHDYKNLISLLKYSLHNYQNDISKSEEFAEEIEAIIDSMEKLIPVLFNDNQ